MKKLMNKIRKANKGFTLVELIIVVAIIAVLAAVAAPQYIKYVEKSRYGTDMNCINEIAHAMEVSAVGDGATTPSGTTLTVTTTSSVDYDSIATGSIGEAVNKVVPEGSYTFKSNAFKGDSDGVLLTLNATTGVVTISSTPTAP